MLTNTVRKPAVAGLFYPASADELKNMVNNFLATVEPSVEPVPKAIIAPHAGYVYSGAIAASAYARLIPAREIIQKVVLLGPSHRVAIQGMAVSSMTKFATPMGYLSVDRKAIEKIKRLPQVTVSDQAHALEHSLEVHLPFLQAVLANFTLVPLVVGEATPSQVAEVLEQLWGGEETLLVISSDLSHYHDYETAKKMDHRTSQAIENLHPEAIHYEQACGRNPVNGLLQLARSRGLQAKTIDLRNSGDTAGSKDQVVGYGAYVFH
jgi:AmmeMemoRadiSam system protein B